MKLSDAEKLIYGRIGQFDGVEKDNLRLMNQLNRNGTPFKAPKNKPWCRITIQYGDSLIAGIANGVCIRDIGFVNVQCFTPLNTGTSEMTRLCDQWREFLQSFTADRLEIYKVHAPQDMDDDNFYAKIIRAEFRVN
ncbi:phage tail terminator-like protein [Acinetobacter gerneri]|jgi:hypothetical protein|uniref:phage tail terminator-like protein n=1 Tax=Acinetobacter gerneri TaxID=202952 RepID=UPI0023F3F284|nr:phage tail terminator-like protein [Acinetobacter gerneri]MCH4243754.1 DUF4128 domain-containing protein [Acinetobacter gerneri]